MRTTGAGAWPVRRNGGSSHASGSGSARSQRECASDGARADGRPVREKGPFPQVGADSGRDRGGALMPSTGVGMWPVRIDAGSSWEVDRSSVTSDQGDESAAVRSGIRPVCENDARLNIDEPPAQDCDPEQEGGGPETSNGSACLWTICDNTAIAHVNDRVALRTSAIGEPAGTSTDGRSDREGDVSPMTGGASHGSGAGASLVSTRTRRGSGTACTGAGVWPVREIDAFPQVGGHHFRDRDRDRDRGGAWSRREPGLSATTTGVWPIRTDTAFAVDGKRSRVRARKGRASGAGGTHRSRRSVHLSGAVTLGVRTLRVSLQELFSSRGRQGGGESAVGVPVDDACAPPAVPSVEPCATPLARAMRSDPGDTPRRYRTAAHTFPVAADSRSRNRGRRCVGLRALRGAGARSPIEAGPDPLGELAFDVAFAVAEAVRSGGPAPGRLPARTTPLAPPPTGMLAGSAGSAELLSTTGPLPVALRDSPPSSAGEVTSVPDEESTTERHGGGDGGRTALLRGGGAAASRRGRSTAFSTIVRCGRDARDTTDTGGVGCGNRPGVHGIRAGDRDGAGGAHGGRHRRGAESARSW